MPSLSTTSSLRRRRALRRLRLSRRRLFRARRGSALVLVLVMTFGMAALVLSGMFLAANATALGKSYDKEADFKYAAEGAIGMGKSRLNNDAFALPDTGFVTLVSGGTMQSADGTPVRGLTYNLFVGPTGSTTGQHGIFASVVAEARDAHGARFVRRVELTQESFAKFAYWSNRERSTGGAVIAFGNGDQLWGPVWSNDSITVSSFGGAIFHDDVGTAKRIAGKPYGTFDKGYKENEKRIELPTNTRLAKLPGYAASGGMSFTAANSGNETQVRTRIEFVAIDLSQPADADSTDDDEGFYCVYDAKPGQEKWLRGDYADPAIARRMCGDFHNGKFYPVDAHNTGNKESASKDSDRDDNAERGWFLDDVYNGSPSSSQRNHAELRFSKIMATPGARCYLGGDPHLVWAEREGLSASVREKGGEDTTFTRDGKYGTWRQWTGTPYAPLVALQTGSASRRRSAQEISTLFPLHRGANAGAKGVVYVNGTAAVSGTVRGRVTLYATGNVIVVDDVRYATDPSSSSALAQCKDILGILSANDVVLADNAIFTPQSTSSGYRNLDDTKDAYLQAVIMALNDSFRVEDYNTGPTDVNDCQGDDVGRGCLYLTGGLIQETRGAVGQSNGTGFVKRYSYDRCAAIRPPPYFPTTGRFLDNRYYEIDPVRFDVTSLFKSLTPNQ